ncbi:MAG: bifunctional (p)ppGpp synthetase/guanosine-3',5'-bis(diphosphate) 3'-pyrophosphohydrolase [Propionibacteriaceae bacterium]|nr:bifunctional (p)ppGpp synthetase/guanosine-3',5'-bis(diphosphate) 3'-pyrophosphohydrolase [Propionibacteriaceae bacterium]
MEEKTVSLPRGAASDQPRMRMRQILARLGTPRPQQSAVLDPLIKIVKEHNKNANVALLEKAYNTAELYHRGQFRKNGDAFITHPLAVATILAGLGMNETTLCAAILHDTVEDTSYTLEQLAADFGEEIATMVDGVTKLDKIQYGASAKAETIRHMVMAMAKDIRVLVIKLGDRLHNMRTLSHLRQDRQEAIARETLEIFAPLAHRMGMNAIKWELEDLAFSTLEPKIYHEIVKMVADRAPLRQEYLNRVIEQVRADLEENGIKATVYGRPKHYYSIYQKMVSQKKDFNDIYDLVGIRVLVDDKAECYEAVGIVHARWAPMPGRFKDYIASPKFNFYQSVHTTVMGPDSKPIELQIRTHEMHRQAEYGVAAHWKYKEGKVAGTEINWVHQLSQWQKEAEDPDEFLDTLRFDVANDEIFCYTPRNDVISLPTGATPVDFAYAVHTEVGHHCVGARVNGKLVPLASTLETGDTVDVITSKAPNAGPSRDWLSIVKSPRARSKIRQYFQRERREEFIEQGKEALSKQLRRASLPIQRLLTADKLMELAEHFCVADINALYAAMGEGTISAQSVVHHLVEETSGGAAGPTTPVIGPVRTPRTSSTEAGVVVQGDPSVWVKLAKCCMPVPPDEIIGFITRESGVSVHRADCTNAADLRSRPERLVEVSWAPTASTSFQVALHIEGLDRMGLASDVTRLLAEQHVSLLSASMNSGKDRTFHFRLTFETSDPRHLDHIIGQLRRLDGVYDVYRA